MAIATWRNSTPRARRGMEATLSLLFPPCCAHCDSMLDVDDIAPQLCVSCVQVFTPTREACDRCGVYHSASIAATDEGCRECRDGKLWFDRVVTLGDYSGPIQDAVIRMKAEQGQSLAVALGRQLARMLDRSGYSENIDLVTCIPKHWFKRLYTAANSPEVIMSGIATQANIPAVSNLLVCRRKIKKQALLSPDQRRRNVKNAWVASQRYDICAARVLLVDDTITTGATANAAAGALKRAGAREVTVAAVGRATKMK